MEQVDSSQLSSLLGICKPPQICYLAAISTSLLSRPDPSIRGASSPGHPADPDRLRNHLNNNWMAAF